MCWHCRVGFLRKEENEVTKDKKCAWLLGKEANKVKKEKFEKCVGIVEKKGE